MHQPQSLSVRQSPFHAVIFPARVVAFAKPTQINNSCTRLTTVPRQRHAAAVVVTCQQAEKPSLEPNQMQIPLPRRSLQVSFTCDKCGARTSRMVNPTAWERGMVIAQCQKCAVWHKLRDQAGLVIEVNYTDEPDELDEENGVPDEAI